MMPICRVAIAVLLLAAACKKDESPAGKAPAAAAPAAAPDPAIAVRAKDKADADEKAAKVNKALAELDADTAAERMRWTDDLKKQFATLSAKRFKNTKEALAAILASPHRQPGHAERDAFRHPLETLTFFGIEPTMTVVEMGAGGGWYTEILAPLLAGGGKLIAVGPDPDGPADAMPSVYGKRLAAMVATAPLVFGKVEVARVKAPDRMELGNRGTADLVFAAREMHGWVRRGEVAAYLAAIHDVLKDGGTFGVVQHRARPGTAPDATGEKGYLPEAWVIAQVEAAGFTLVDRSEINANPRDTTDHLEGVWTLPPSYKLGETDKAKYAAIGESDRMTLKFVKIAAPAPAAPATR